MHFFTKDLITFFSCDFTKATNDLINYKWSVPENYRLIYKTTEKNRRKSIKKWADNICQKENYIKQRAYNDFWVRLEKGKELIDKLDLDKELETAEAYFDFMIKLENQMTNHAADWNLKNEYRPYHILEKIYG